MSTPEAKATDTQIDTDNKSVSFEDSVNKAISQMTKDDKGNWQVPDTIEDEAVRFAAQAEKRYRDTQSSYTKSRQHNKALEAEKALLHSKIVGSIPVELTAEQKEELEDLKFSDPDKWRIKLNKYESKAREEYNTALENEVKQVSASTLEANELEDRAKILSQFNSEFPDFKIDDDVIANDIPPRITNKLKNGEISFREFLTECYDYSTTGKIVKPTEGSAKLSDLSKIGGGSSPDANAMKEDALISYSKEVY